MKCLHICNDLLGSKVHRKLYEKLDSRDLEQYIFHPLRKNLPDKASEIQFRVEMSRVCYSRPIKKYHRVLFRNKMEYLLTDIKKGLNLKEIDVIHATTFFSDGALALKINEQYAIPYVVAVRVTDISIFLNMRPDLRKLGRKILKRASKIIFISKSLEKNFANHTAMKGLRKEIEAKSVILPNGLDEFWLQNINPYTEKKSTRLLYIGTFLKRKKVLELVQSVLDLQDQLPGLKISIVGKNGQQEDDIKSLAKANSYIVDFLGPIYDKQELMRVYREHDVFAMISKHETFGLVYLEALTQGLPLLYSKDEGIDGMFNETVGIAVNPDSPEEIKKGIQKVLDQRNSFKLQAIDFKMFSWDYLAEQYLELYSGILK